MGTSTLPSSPSRNVAGGLLLAYPGTPRHDIDDWANQLRRALDARAAWPRDSVEHLARVIGSTNAIALLEAHRGDLAAATRICDAQLRLVVRHPRSAELAVARHAVNPWLNLGRLASLRGDVAEALGRFAVFHPRTGPRLRVGELTLGRRALNELLQNEIAFPDFAARLWVVESLRTLVRARDGAALRAFVADPAARRAAHSAGAGVEAILAEAGVARAMMEGDFDTAGRDAEALAQRAGGIPQLVFALRTIESRSACGRRGGAGTTRRLARARPVLQALLDTQSPPLVATALALHAAQIAAAAGRPRVAWHLADEALQAAARQRDQVLRHAALALLATLPGAGAARAQAALLQLRASTGYHLIRGMPAARSPALTSAIASAEAALGAPLPATPGIGPS